MSETPRLLQCIYRYSPCHCPGKRYALLRRTAIAHCGLDHHLSTDALLRAAPRFGDRIILPTDVLIADKFAPDANTKVVQSGEIPDGWMVRLFESFVEIRSCCSSPEIVALLQAVTTCLITMEPDRGKSVLHLSKNGEEDAVCKIICKIYIDGMSLWK